MAISDKKALDSAKMLVDFCKEQIGCQNCVFRKFGADHWNCVIEALGLADAIANYDAKRKNRGWL